MMSSCNSGNINIPGDFDCHKIISVAQIFLQDPFSETTYQKICDMALEISSSKYAVFNIYEEDGESYSSVAVSGIGSTISKASEILGFDVREKKWENHLEKISKLSGSVITKFDSLHDLTGSKAPVSLIKFIETSFNIGSAYVAKIERKSKIIGDFVLICEKGASIKNHDLIELYSKLAGMFILRKKAEEDLKKSHDQYMLAVEGSRDGIWDWDIKTDKLFLSERWKQIVGYKDSELENKIGVFESLLHPDDKDRVAKYLSKYLKGEVRPYSIEFRMQHKNGTYRWILGRGEALYDENGLPYRMAGSHTDITEQKELEKKLESLAATDDLSNLWNRRYFFNVGDRECKRAVRYKAKLSLLMIDIDHFKEVNDTYGHAAGDIVLKEISEIFIHGLRDVDIAARIGGEEFAVLMPNTDVAGAMIVAERLRTNIEMLNFEHEGHKIKTTISLGVTECCGKSTIDEMLKRADKALYDAKNAGRNCVKVCLKS